MGGCAVTEKRDIGIGLRMVGDIMLIRKGEGSLHFQQTMGGTADARVL